MPRHLAYPPRQLLPDQVLRLRPRGHRPWPALVAVPASLALLVSGCGEARDQEQQAAGEPSAEATATEADRPAPSPTADGDSDDSGESGDSPETFTFVSFEFGYDPPPQQIPPGEHVFRLVNDGMLTHDVTIEELGDETVVEVSGGDTDQGRVTLEPGTYTYYCDEPGHRLAGMEGTLEVAAPDD